MCEGANRTQVRPWLRELDGDAGDGELARWTPKVWLLAVQHAAQQQQPEHGEQQGEQQGEHGEPPDWNALMAKLGRIDSSGDPAASEAAVRAFNAARLRAHTAWHAQTEMGGDASGWMRSKSCCARAVRFGRDECRVRDSGTCDDGFGFVPLAMEGRCCPPGAGDGGCGVPGCGAAADLAQLAEEKALARAAATGVAAPTSGVAENLRAFAYGYCLRANGCAEMEPLPEPSEPDAAWSASPGRASWELSPTCCAMASSLGRDSCREVPLYERCPADYKPVPLAAGECCPANNGDCATTGCAAAAEAASEWVTPFHSGLVLSASCCAAEDSCRRAAQCGPGALPVPATEEARCCPTDDGDQCGDPLCFQTAQEAAAANRRYHVLRLRNVGLTGVAEATNTYVRGRFLRGPSEAERVTADYETPLWITSSETSRPHWNSEFCTPPLDITRKGPYASKKECKAEADAILGGATAGGALRCVEEGGRWALPAATLELSVLQRRGVLSDALLGTVTIDLAAHFQLGIEATAAPGAMRDMAVNAKLNQLRLRQEGGRGEAEGTIEFELSTHAASDDDACAGPGAESTQSAVLRAGLAQISESVSVPRRRRAHAPVRVAHAPHPMHRAAPCFTAPRRTAPVPPPTNASHGRPPARRCATDPGGVRGHGRRRPWRRR